MRFPATLALGDVFLTQVHLGYLLYTRYELVFFKFKEFLKLKFFLLGVNYFHLAHYLHQFDGELDSTYF